MIYLDNNATTPMLPEVLEAFTRAAGELFANPSSVHRAGQASRQAIDLARKDLAALIGARPRTVTLTGSGTEAIDLAIRGSLLAQGRLGAKATRPPGVIITTRVEHSAVRELVENLGKTEGVTVEYAKLDEHGVVDPASVEALLEQHRGNVALVSVQWANNETGAIIPIAEIIAMCRGRGVGVHTDATQAVGKLPVDVESAGADADLITFSPHKFHGPKGVGVLYQRPGFRTAPVIHGEQEQGRRGGTENVAGIVASGMAARLALEWVNNEHERARVGGLRDRFEKRVLELVPDARVNGPVEKAGEPVGSRRLPNTTNIGFPRLEAEALLLLLSERGVFASAGAACSSGSLEPSPVLLAMGIPAERAHGSLRFSFSRLSTQRDADEGAQAVAECVARLRSSMAE